MTRNDGALGLLVVIGAAAVFATVVTLALLPYVATALARLPR